MRPSDSSQFKPATSGIDRRVTLEIVAKILTPFRCLRSGWTMATIHDLEVAQLEKDKKVRPQKKAGDKTR
jgi:hypothetical protein